MCSALLTRLVKEHLLFLSKEEMFGSSAAVSPAELSVSMIWKMHDVAVKTFQMLRR